jgi:hypothetical protein
LTALRASLVLLEATQDAGKQLTIEIATLENDIEEKVYESRQDVPVKLPAAEMLEYSNKCKAHSVRVAALEKHWGNVYSLIYGQCTQILQDKMKQDEAWTAVSASYKPLELYKLIKRVVLKQTEDQYPVAAIWDQMTAVYSVRQGNLSNNEWYKRFTTKVIVAESVGCQFDFEKIWEYCSQVAHSKSYNKLTLEKQESVTGIAKERLLAYALLRMSSNNNDKIKLDLFDDFTKGNNNYPETRQLTLLMLDKYTKKPMAITASEGTAFVPKGKKSRVAKKANNNDREKLLEYNKEYFKDKMCFRCGKKGHPKSTCTAKLTSDDESS